MFKLVKAILMSGLFEDIFKKDLFSFNTLNPFYELVPEGTESMLMFELPQLCLFDAEEQKLLRTPLPPYPISES